MTLFPSSLIISSSPQSSRQKALEIFSKLNHLPDNNPDLFELTDYSVEAVRKLKKFLSQKAYNHPSKIIFIPEAHQLNLESQNTLLKTLEDPGENNYIILTSTHPARLLPTIISRCHQIKVTDTQSIKSVTLVKTSGQVKKDLNLAPTLYIDKNEIKNLLLEQITAWQAELIKQPSAQNAKKLSALIHSLELIETNVDPKSALDWFLLS